MGDFFIFTVQYVVPAMAQPQVLKKKTEKREEENKSVRGGNCGFYPRFYRKS